MTSEIETIKQEIEILTAKLQLLEEIEKHNAKPKMTLENEGDFSIVTYNGGIYYRLQYPTVVSWFKRTMSNFTLEYIDDINTKNELESLWLMNDVKYQNNTEEVLGNPPKPTRNNYFERILNAPIDERGYVDLRKPQMSEFRQKLFNGIKSVFYGPDYEKTHWEVKVNIAVDEVLTHFYDVIPDEVKAPCNVYDEGWNNCIKLIKYDMERELMELDDDN
jgi:hypothetical protein